MAIIKIDQDKTWSTERWVFDWVLKHAIEKLDKDTSLYRLLYTRMMTRLGGLSYDEISETDSRALNIALREVYQDLQIQGMALFNTEEYAKEDDEARQARHQEVTEEMGRLITLLDA